MHFSESSHSLLFFFMPFSKDIQCGCLGHVQSLEVRRVLGGSFSLVFSSLFWLRLYRGFGNGPGIFQSLKLRERERRERSTFLNVFTNYCMLHKRSQNAIKMCKLSISQSTVGFRFADLWIYYAWN